MDVLIHVGYIKTGSTWLQKHFFPFVENTACIDRRYVFNKIIKPDNENFNTEEILKYFNNFSDKNIIISQESLIGGVFMQQIKRNEIANRIKILFPEAKIVIFIRNQAELISSAYSMHVKLGETRKITDYIFNKSSSSKNISYDNFLFDFLKFDNIISLYQNLFGINNVKVFLYEDLLADNLKFLNDFKGFYNFEIEIDSLDFNKENIRLRKKLYGVKRFSNLFTKHDLKFTGKKYIVDIPYWSYYSRKFINNLNHFKIFGDYPTALEVLGQNNYDFICEYFKASNNELYSKFNLKDIKKYNYPL